VPANKDLLQEKKPSRRLVTYENGHPSIVCCGNTANLPFENGSILFAVGLSTSAMVKQTLEEAGDTMWRAGNWYSWQNSPGNVLVI